MSWSSSASSCSSRTRAALTCRRAVTCRPPTPAARKGARPRRATTTASTAPRPGSPDREEAMTSSREPSRRDLFGPAAGLGAVAPAWLLDRDGCAAERPAGPHFPARAKRVIQVFSPGGVSHVDTFDYKPDLAKHHGQELTGKGKVDTFFQRPGPLMKSPFAFKQHGSCGRWVSSIWPHLARRLDDVGL